MNEKYVYAVQTMDEHEGLPRLQEICDNYGCALEHMKCSTHDNCEYVRGDKVETIYKEPLKYDKTRLWIITKRKLLGFY